MFTRPWLRVRRARMKHLIASRVAALQEKVTYLAWIDSSLTFLPICSAPHHTRFNGGALRLTTRSPKWPRQARLRTTTAAMSKSTVAKTSQE